MAGREHGAKPMLLEARVQLVPRAEEQNSVEGWNADRVDQNHESSVDLHGQVFKTIAVRAIVHE